MAASVPSSGSLITHLVSRIESDLTFLASHNLVTAPELAQIRSTLAEAQVRANGAALELLALRNDPNAAGGSMMPVPAQQQWQTVTPPKAQCKAVWDYTKSQVSLRSAWSDPACMPYSSRSRGDGEEGGGASLSQRDSGHSDTLH